MSTREVGVWFVIWFVLMMIGFLLIPGVTGWWATLIVMPLAALLALPVARVLDRRLFGRHT